MFLQNTFRFIRGYIQIKIEGYFIERFLNMCAIRGVETWNIKRVNNIELIVCIKRKDFKAVQEIAYVTRCEILKEKEKGIPNLVIKYKRRKVFIISIIFLAICFKIYTERIWKIEIVGDFDIPIEDLWNELELENVRVGIRKKDIDFDKIKNNIYLRRNDIAWLGFKIDGVKTYIEFVQRFNTPENNLNNPCDIVSTKDGIVSKIQVKEGRRVVNVDDFVSKGDVLISGTIKDINNNEYLVHANGIVELKTWYTYKVNLPYETDLISKTGNKKNDYKLSVGSYEINLLNTGTKFEKYDTIISKNSLRFIGKFVFPICLTTTTYEELEINTIKYSKEQAEKMAQNEALEGLKREISDSNINIVSIDYKAIIQDDFIQVEAIAECIESNQLEKYIN